LTERIGRQRGAIEELKANHDTIIEYVRQVELDHLETMGRVANMSDWRCGCKDSPKVPSLTGEGSAEQPFELEYEGGSDGSYHSPPTTPGEGEGGAGSPQPEDGPIPVPVPSCCRGVVAIVEDPLEEIEEEEEEEEEEESAPAQVRRCLREGFSLLNASCF
jgi:hypothetical protein